jgi:hypothetical protein
MRIMAWCVLHLGCAGMARSESWPSWLGPRGDGTSVEKDLPTTWSAYGFLLLGA